MKEEWVPRNKLTKTFLIDFIPSGEVKKSGHH